jgi:hypothetical protein
MLRTGNTLFSLIPDWLSFSCFCHVPCMKVNFDETPGESDKQTNALTPNFLFEFKCACNPCARGNNWSSKKFFAMLKHFSRSLWVECRALLLFHMEKEVKKTERDDVKKSCKKLSIFVAYEVRRNRYSSFIFRRNVIYSRVTRGIPIILP